MHDTNPPSLLRWEAQQRREAGYDTAQLEAQIGDVLSARPLDPERITALYTALTSTLRRPDWPYIEPDDLATIMDSLPTSSPAAAPEAAVLSDQLLGAWAGRCAGCNLGKPIELGDYWTVEHIREYLEIAEAWPLDDYVPALDPMPQGFELRACWTATTRGNVVASARDDDIDYAMLALHVLETYGRGYTTADVAREWLDRLPYTQTYTAERAAYRNLINELDIPAVGGMNNPYREWVGAQIRADVYGYVNPGDPRSAATLAYQDAVLSHRANGIYGEMWAAALVDAAITADGARAAVVESLRHIPPTSRLHEALTGVLALHERGHTWESARQTIGEQLGHYNWVHTIPNAALVTAGVLWGGGDFTQTIALTVTGGWDTDSNGATAGSVAGILTGANRIPAQWIAPLNDTVRSSLAGFDGVRISDLASRTHALTRG